MERNSVKRHSMNNFNNRPTAKKEASIDRHGKHAELNITSTAVIHFTSKLHSFTTFLYSDTISSTATGNRMKVVIMTGAHRLVYDRHYDIFKEV
jgi:hypothetical protein